MRCKFVLILFIVFFLSFISASFENGNLSHQIKNEYIRGDFIRGWINISLDDVDLTATFETNNGSSITLSDLLNLSNLISECEVPNCDVDYVNISSGESTRVLDLVQDVPQLVGFKFNNNLNDISDINFTVSTNAQQNCFNQFKIDVLNDGSLDFKNEFGSGVYCNAFKTKGCFDDEKASSNTFTLSTNPFCQRVELPESRGVRLGAYLIGTATKNSVGFRVYNLDGSVNGLSCINESVLGTGEFFCDIEGFVSEETAEYYICVSGDSADEIYIPGYEDYSNGCGFYGIPTRPEVASYNLTAYSHQFAGNIEDFSLVDKNTNFINEVKSYIVSKYGSLDCANKNCIVPIKILPGVNQRMTFSNLKGKEVVAGGPRNMLNLFYNLSEVPLKYNSGFQQIYLDNASLSVGTGDVFSLSLDGKEIFSQDIEVKVVPLINFLVPLITAATVQTEFAVSAYFPGINASITNYHWDFGNGDFRDTSTNSVNYTYDSVGNFDLMITLTGSNNLTSSKNFSIIIKPPIEVVETVLNEKLNSLDTLKSQVKTFSVFTQTSLQPILNLVDAENKLTKIKISFDNAVPGVEDVYYINLMKDLFEINLPNSIKISKSAKMLPFFPSEKNINLDVLKSLEGDYDVNRKQDYSDAILLWNINNLANTIDYTEISAEYGDGLETILNVFELNINKKIDSETTSFFILKKIDSFKFEKNYNKRELDNYIFISLDTNSKITFSTTEKISFSDLPLFISPMIGNLNVSKKIVEEEGISKWVLFGLIISFLILVAIVIYIILQRWYAKKYEDYLFKNKNDLYNLISFIENAKKNNITNDKIITSLKKSGWKGEQLRYIIRKYLGKRTGMLEIPIEKILNLFNKKQTINQTIPQKNLPKKSGINPFRGRK